MSPSSLIFVAVVAIWAAYLVVDTTRRREYLATARTVDRFSASMRVLQRRAVRRESAEAFEASTAPMRGTSSTFLHGRPQSTSRVVAEVRAAEAAAPPAKPRRSGGERELAERQRLATRRRRARLLAGLTLVMVAVTVATAVLTGLGMLTWVVPAVGVVLTTALVVTMRRLAVAGRPQRRSAPVRPTARVESHEQARPVVRRRQAAEAEAVRAADDLRPAATAMPVAQEYIPFDYAREVEPAVVAEETVATAGPERDLLLGEEGWAPVPVPPPTYTLKARAEHPVPEPIEVEPVPVAIDDEWDDFIEQGGYGRRASGQ